MVAVVAIVMIAALVLPAFGRVRRQARVEACAANLHALHQAQAAHYGKPGAPAPQLGAAYWGALAKTTPPLVQPETLRCPVNEDPQAPAVQYLGPAADPRAMVKDDPIGCDTGANHSDTGREGGNILLRSGSVVNDNVLHEGGLWGTAVGRACRP